MGLNVLGADVTRELERLPRKRREAISDTLTAVARTLLSRPSASILELESRLRETAPVTGEPETASPELLEELETRNALRRFASWRRVEERCIPGPELARALGVSRQRLEQLRDERRLLALRIPFRREAMYPVWQFGPDGSPLPVMPRVLQAAEEARLSALDLDALVTSEGAGNGRTPAELLRAGETEYVLGLVRAALDQGA
jgi:hypothetical protein